MTAAPGTSEARSAEAYVPRGSPVVLDIVSYRFGRQPEATRPDRVMRAPTAAILLQQHGALFKCDAAGNRTTLPAISLLGPSGMGQVWATLPDTRFTLVNLAPGAALKLFGLDPRDIGEQVEPLRGHRMADGMVENLARSREALHQYLCSVRPSPIVSGPGPARRGRAIVSSLMARACGDLVQNYADQFGVTMRTLQRTVRAAVGLTPKQVLAVARIRGLVTLTSGGWSRTLADLAQAGGYFDQSHMRYELNRHEFGRAEELVDGDHVAAPS